MKLSKSTFARRNGVKKVSKYGIPFRDGEGGNWVVHVADGKLAVSPLGEPILALTPKQHFDSRPFAGLAICTDDGIYVRSPECEARAETLRAEAEQAEQEAFERMLTDLAIQGITVIPITPEALSESLDRLLGQDSSLIEVEMAPLTSDDLADPGANG